MEAAPPTALVINDDPSQLHLASTLLQRDGLRVVRCQHAEEALHVLNAGSTVDVIITDLYMPGIDGWRFCRLLRSPEYAAFNTTPVLILSATFSGTDAEQVTADLGANAFLPVPYDPATLRVCVRDLLAGRIPQAMRRVLIIEDEPTQSIILQRAFEAHGYTVYTAPTGATGQRLFREYTPEIAIIDYHLPDMTGAQLLAELVRPETPTVAIMITANPTPELALECIRLGADGYVRKPFNPAYLLDLCMKARRERALLRVEDLLEERTRALRESEAKFRALFDSIPDTVLVHDAQGTILHINNAGSQWLGWPAADLIGRPLRDLMAPHCVDQIADHVQHALATGASSFKTVYVSRTGQYVEAEVNKRRIEFEGRVALLDVARDITERLRLEAQLRQVEKLQAIGTLAGGIAHDFNNILAAVLGYTELAIYDLPPASPSQRHLQEVLSAALRAKALVQQIVAFSRQQALERQPIQLHLLINEALSLLQASLPPTITLRPHIAAAAATVLADAGQMQQLLMHLCNNAVYAMRDTGGVLEVGLDRVDVPADAVGVPPTLAPGPYVRLLVRDTGCGMTPEVMTRIFEPFFTTREVGEGSGMGLAVVDGIVTSHGGAITVTSAPEQGTTFEVYLPEQRPGSQAGQG
jgi:PAS domain S-box-containing protein